MSQGSWSCRRGYDTMQINKEVTIDITVHDKMPELRQKEVGGGHLRHKVITRFETIRP